MMNANTNDELGAPPAHLNAELAALWSEIAAGIPEGVAGRSDAHAFELLVRLVARIRAGTFSSAEAAQSRMLLDNFGLSPLGRARLAPQYAAWKP